MTGLVKNTPAGYFLLRPTLTDNLLFLAHSHKFFSPLLFPAMAASGLEGKNDLLRIVSVDFPVMVSNMRPLPTPLSCVWPYLGQFWEKNQS